MNAQLGIMTVVRMPYVLAIGKASLALVALVTQGMEIAAMVWMQPNSNIY